MQKQISNEELEVRNADFKKRHLQFDKDLKDLVKKYEVVLEAEPFIFRGLLIARPTISDGRKYTDDVTPDTDDVASTETDTGDKKDGDDGK